jgi:hypothetical protein
MLACAPMMYALHTVVVLFALGAADDATSPAPTASTEPALAAPPVDDATATEAPPATETAPPEAGVTLPPDAPPEDKRPVVAFLGVASSETERAVATRVDEEVRALLLADRAIVFSPSSAPILESACFSEEACRATQAKELEGAYVVAARVRPEVAAIVDGIAAPAKIALDLVLFERMSGRAESELTYVEGDEAALLARAGAAYVSLFTAILAPAAPKIEEPAPVVEVPAADDEGLGFETEEPAPRRLETAPAPVAPPTTTEPQALDEGVAVGTWIYIAAFVAGGAVLALSGAAFDVVSPTSTNGTLDPLDAVGPTLVVAGALVAAVGVATGLLFTPFAGSSDAEEN